MQSTSKTTRLALLTVILCAGALFAFYSNAAQDDAADDNVKIKYEYKVIRNVIVRGKAGATEKQAEQFLNKLGEEGWKFENVAFDGKRLTSLSASSQFLIAHRIVE